MKFAAIASVGAMIPGPIGMASAAAAAAAYAAAGDKRQAAIMVGSIALAAVGAGGAVVAIKAVKAVKTANSAREFKSTMALGRQAHKVFQAKYGLRETYLGKAGRADGMTATHVIGLKPHNSRAMAQGMTQLSRYQKASGLSGQLWTYRKNAIGKLKFKCQKGCR